MSIPSMHSDVHSRATALRCPNGGDRSAFPGRCMRCEADFEAASDDAGRSPAQYSLGEVLGRFEPTPWWCAAVERGVAWTLWLAVSALGLAPLVLLAGGDFSLTDGSVLRVVERAQWEIVAGGGESLEAPVGSRLSVRGHARWVIVGSADDPLVVKVLRAGPERARAPGVRVSVEALEPPGDDRVVEVPRADAKRGGGRG